MTVRTHIYQKHLAPSYCGRCLQSFADAGKLKKHTNVPNANICDVNDGQAPDGITAEQQLNLKNRAKDYLGQSDEELWFKIYRSIFPSEEVPATPCE